MARALTRATLVLFASDAGLRAPFVPVFVEMQANWADCWQDLNS